MKRIELTVPIQLLEDLGILSARFFRHNDRLEILQSFLVRPTIAAMFIRVWRRGHFKDLREVEREARAIARRYRLKRFEILSANPDRGEYVAWIEWRVPPTLLERIESGLAGVVPVGLSRSGPQEVQISLLAANDAVPRVRELLTELDTPYRAMSVRSGASASAQPLAGLTPRQRKLLEMAYRLGYYESPARISLARMGTILGISKAAVSKHLRAAERKIMIAIVGEERVGLEVQASGLPQIRPP
jgi:DNA-binding CsgD family transcriptional regulator